MTQCKGCMMRMGFNCVCQFTMGCQLQAHLEEMLSGTHGDWVTSETRGQSTGVRVISIHLKLLSKDNYTRMEAGTIDARLVLIDYWLQTTHPPLSKYTHTQTKSFLVNTYVMLVQGCYIIICIGYVNCTFYFNAPFCYIS